MKIWDLEQYEDKIAIEWEDGSLSYRELHELAERIASPVGRRNLAFILASNTVGSVAGYVSFLNHETVPLMIDAQIDEKLLSDLLREYRPAFLWVPQECAPTFRDYEEIYSEVGYVLLESKVVEQCPLYDELALLITTSGSTGSPKLVRQSYKNILSNTRSIIEYLEITENERAITTLPMNYVYGLSVINTHLYAGATLILTEENCYSKRFWEFFEKMGATSFAGVPFMYEMLNKLRFTKRDISSLKTMTQAGGKLSKELQDVFCTYAVERGKQFVIMYGASEATSRMGYLPFEQALKKRGSIGIAIPGGRYDLIDADGSIITESDVVGELQYTGDNVTLGYAEKREDLEKGDDNRGRLLTGDMAYRDADGYYYIAGRKKRFLKMLGKRISLDETEALLKTEFHMGELVCGGKDDSLRIYVTDGSMAEPIRRYVFEKLGINSALCKVGTVREIPKSNAGKVLYAELNKMRFLEEEQDG